MSGRRSSTATSSVSVELLVLSFCLVELLIKDPSPNDIVDPVCPFASGCTPKDPSIHQLTILRLSMVNLSFKSSVQLIYRRSRFNFFQSSTSLVLTRVQRKATGVWVSGQAHFDPNSNFVTIWWNISESFLFSRIAFMSTSNKWWTAGVAAYVLQSSGNAWTHSPMYEHISSISSPGVEKSNFIPS